jgi:cyclomaltodextrinase / maltogenic alpha-amylase / neopullulanase
MNYWFERAIFYHIYPLGFCGAPARSGDSDGTLNRLARIADAAAYLKELGITALYLGPLFESLSHGYDTTDYYRVDRRLGSNDDLRELVHILHENGIRVVLDAVFNHVGRNFFAFRDVLSSGSGSCYSSWFANLRFDQRSPLGDPFDYQPWNGHYELVKLNLQNDDVKQHLLAAIAMWIREFNIDGLRLDAADCIDIGFQQELSNFTKNLKDDFWLLGEIIHGDYTRWANPRTLDSVTNYECYKGLYSSHNDLNYHEIAFSLKRQSGEKGLYKDLKLYTFADNHDVTRLATILKNRKHLYPVYSLLFTMPGIPALYYGSEAGITGKKEGSSDAPLRPELDLYILDNVPEQKDLRQAIKKLIEIRKNNIELQLGDYQELYVDAATIAFSRNYQGRQIICAVSAKASPCEIEIPQCGLDGINLHDLFNPGDNFCAVNGKLKLPLHPNWARILKPL